MSLSSDDDLPFSVIGHFQIIARVGQGGMGDVYKGYEEALDRMVAIKVLPSELARQEDFARRFRAEATAVARITHPNVVPIHFIGEHQGHHFFAMQFVEGESLADLLGRRGRLTPEEALAIIEQTLSGLAAAHKQGIVHRDIKPGNILLDRENGQALLADFGLVKSIESGTKMTGTGVIMGTVDYVSPEQGRGQDVDARSDLYSAGVLIYQMLSGSLPFEADSPTAMIFQHVYEEPKPLKKAAPDVPDTLCTVIHKLLAKSPDDRHQTAEDVLADLRAFKAGRPLPSATEARAIVSDESPITPAARPQTRIIEAPGFEEALPLPAELTREAPLKWWQQGRKRLLDLVRRRTPEFVQRLQNTQQQVDGAVIEYERRRDDLQDLVSEAEDVLKELKRQAENYRQEAAAAERRADSAVDGGDAQKALEDKTACQQTADELAEQIAEQEKQLETMHLRLAKVNATLQTVRSQRDLLNARLKVAQAQIDLTARSPKRVLVGKILRIGAAMVIGGLVILAAVLFWPGSKSTDSSSVAIGDFGERVIRFEAKPVCLAFTPPATFGLGFGFATGNEDGTISLYQIGQNGQVELHNRLFGHIEEINAITFSPDGKRFATASDDGTVRVWETWGDPRRTELRRFEAPHGSMVAVVFTQDGSQILSSGGGLFQLWDIRTQTEIKRSKGGAGAMALSRDGKYVLEGWALWNLVDHWKEIDFDTNKNPVPAVALSRSEDQAYLFHSGSIWVYDLTSGQVIRQFGEDIRAAAFSPATERVWTANKAGGLRLWDVKTGEVVQEFATHSEGIYRVALSPDGTKGLSANYDGTLRVWDLPPTSPPEY